MQLSFGWAFHLGSIREWRALFSISSEAGASKKPDRRGQKAVGPAGEHIVQARLLVREWTTGNVNTGGMMNAPAVDLLAAKASQNIRIAVKTTGHGPWAVIAEHLENPKGRAAYDDIAPDLDAIYLSKTKETTKQGQIEARLGQGQFRTNVAKRWNDQCAVSFPAHRGGGPFSRIPRLALLLCSDWKKSLETALAQAGFPLPQSARSLVVFRVE